MGRSLLGSTTLWDAKSVRAFRTILLRFCTEAFSIATPACSSDERIRPWPHRTGLVRAGLGMLSHAGEQRRGPVVEPDLPLEVAPMIARSMADWGARRCVEHRRRRRRFLRAAQKALDGFPSRHPMCLRFRSRTGMGVEPVPKVAQMLHEADTHSGSNLAGAGLVE